MLKNKVIVITGGSSGIGAEMAVQAAGRGAVTVAAARSTEKLADLTRTADGSIITYTLDVTSSEQVEHVIGSVIERYGQIDALVNNAGFGLFERCVDTPIEHYEAMMDVNYMGVVRCTKAVLPHMLARGSGHIVNIASLAGKIGTAKATGYAASKHAVLGFTNSLRQELNGTGVLVSAVNPGPIDTPFMTIADPSGNYSRNMKRFFLSAEQVAIEVLNVIAYPKPELDLPRYAGIGARVYHLFPRLADMLAHKFINKK
jgi:short-subunit dehydrogenase